MLRDREGFFPEKVRHKGARGLLLQTHVATFTASHRRVPVELQSQVIDETQTFEEICLPSRTVFKK